MIHETDDLRFSLEQKLRCWKEEFKNKAFNGSNMKADDLWFLENQIAKLERLEADFWKDVDAVEVAVKNHTKDW